MKNAKVQLLTAMCALALTGVSFAGIKYWDNPAFKAYDVGDYVQDGLVLNYDGICNAGPNAAHDPAATTWVNCKTPGTYDLTKVSLADSTASWAEGKGFHFDGKAYFKYPAKATLPAVYEFETLLDAKTSDATAGIGQIYFSSYTDPRTSNDGAWGKSSLAIRKNGSPLSQDGRDLTLAFNTHTFTSKRPGLAGVTSFNYLTSLANSTYTCVFTELEEPTTAPGRYDGTTGSFDAYFFLGGHGADNDNNAVAETVVGTMKSFRRYDKVLTAEERAWNRVVDEARYFNRRAALPVTNVVVASNIPIVTGDEPVGCYAVDAGGYTFSVPASKVVKGRTYTLDGFTVETWDGSAWGAAAQHTGETSYTATDAALVRLTWQWTPGDGLVAYDADDYVQDGLVINYDGIRNAGPNAAHDPNATTWKNLGTGGATYDMVKGGAATSSAWGNDGFVFAGDAYFKSASKQTLPEYYEIQTLVDAKASDATGIGYIYTRVFADTWNSSDTAWNGSSIAVRPTWSQTVSGTTYKGSLVFNTHYYSNGRPMVPSTVTTYDYMTALGESKAASLFTGLAVPAEMPGRASPQSGSWAARNASYIYLGGHDNGSDVGEALTGTVKNFRYYSRILSENERAWNRTVDEARYFTDPNVVVASTRSNVQANEADGDYRVSGSYTFTAPESVTVGNITYEPAGYAIQTWDDMAGVWGAATEYTGASYAYTTAAGKVRLLWRWKAVSGIRAAADYDVSDYVAGGLVLNFDGIRNVGADVGHAVAPETWVNLGTSGAAANATIRAGDAARVVNWTDKGYYFDGNTRFFATIPYTTTFTLQLCTDAVQNNQHNPDSAHMYPFTTDNKGFAISTYDTRLYFRTQGNDPEYALGFAIDKTRPIGYVTAMLDDASKTARIFPGTTSSAGGSKTYDSMSATKYTNLTLGGGGSGASQFWTGTINYFRYYDRVLSDAELEQNRQVDAARYFGALGVTNVFVVAGGGTQVETGAYKVEGEWTFTATTMLNRRGETVPVERYSIETLVNGAWTNKQTRNGNSYTYTEGTSPETVRLKWLGRPDGVLVIMR